MFLHLAAMALGQVATGSLLATAARVYGWSEDYKDLLMQVCFLIQGILQALVNYISQAYNVDGTKPGTVTVSTTPQPAPKTTVTIVENKKAE